MKNSMICESVLTLYPMCKLIPHLAETRVNEKQLKRIELQYHVLEEISSGLISTQQIGFVLTLEFQKLLDMKVKQCTRMVLAPSTQLHSALTSCLVCLCSGQPRAKGQHNAGNWYLKTLKRHRAGLQWLLIAWSLDPIKHLKLLSFPYA